MNSTVGPEDVRAAAAACREVLSGLVDLDWSISAGELEWSCHRCHSPKSHAPPSKPYGEGRGFRQEGVDQGSKGRRCGSRGLQRVDPPFRSPPPRPKNLSSHVSSYPVSVSRLGKQPCLTPILYKQIFECILPSLETDNPKLNI